MRESSCRDQCAWQGEEERVAAAVRRGELAVRGEGGAVLDRADQAEDGGAVAGLGGHVDDARDPRAPNLPPRGGSCAPVHGRTTASRLRLESDVRTRVRAYPRWVDLPGFVLRMKRRWVANGLPD